MGGGGITSFDETSEGPAKTPIAGKASKAMVKAIILFIHLPLVESLEIRN
jgi:hypothetical protein